MKTTLNEIRKHGPCGLKPNGDGQLVGLCKLLHYLGKTTTDDEPLSIRTILDSNGLDDALWCLRAVTGHDREIRLLAVGFARQVQHLMPDPRSRAALDVAERFANGMATSAEMVAAGAAAWAVAWTTACTTLGAAGAAAWTTLGDAPDAAWTAAGDARAAAGDEARDAQKTTLLRALDETEGKVV